MQKTLAILEQNVQWFALGLGAIILLWSGYHYFVKPIAVVQIANQSAGPGDVSIETRNGPGKRVEDQLASKNAPAFQSPNVVVALQTQIANPVPAGTTLGQWVFEGGTGQIQNSGPEVPTFANIHLAAVPELPPADPVGVSSGLSVVRLPEAPPAAGAKVKPVANVQPRTEDLDWGSAFFKISAAAINKAFAAPLKGQQIDASIYNTMVLEVTLQRQAATGADDNGPVFPDGDQGVEQVKPLRIYNGQIVPIPPETATLKQKYEYIDWAQKHPDLVYQPAFYEVVAGSAWSRPTDNAAAPADAATQPAPDTAPATRPADEPTPAASKTGRHTVGLAPANGRVYVDADYPPPAPDDRRRTDPWQHAPPQYRKYMQGNGGRPYDPRSFRPDLSRPQIPGVMPGFNTPGAADGQIDPLTVSDDIDIWAHDDTVVPGRTYRYRVVYKMKNPVFGVTNLADPKLVEKLALVSPPSKWSDAVKVPLKTRFWVNRLDHEKAVLDVYHWVNGEWKKTADKSATLTAGDLVPNTDWTLVDVRGSNNNKYVLLTDATGVMDKHELKKDQEDPDHKDLEDQSNPAKAQGTAGQTPTPPTPVPTVPRNQRTYGPGPGRGGPGIPPGYGGTGPHR